MAFNTILPDAVDLFCGAGGLSRGLEDAGIHVLAGVPRTTQTMTFVK